MLVPALEWNLAIGLQSERHARRQMRALTALIPPPRVLVLVEARRALYDVYVSELSSRTQAAWGGVLQSHCARGGWNSATSGCDEQDDECVMILSSFPVVSGGGVLLPHADSWHSARAAVHAAIDVDGTTVNVFGTHLQAGVGSAAAQLPSVAILKNWIAGFGGAAIVAGDFNAPPASELIAGATSGMASAFADVWQMCGSGEAATFPVWWPTRQLDYWFVNTTEVVRTISTHVARNVRLSDHYPLAATFEVVKTRGIRNQEAGIGFRSESPEPRA